MNTSRVAKIRRPPKELRDQMRRDQIVEAAQQCVVRHGFHAASMAEIATVAQMSVGQIYRYFPNKEAIVHAIVERIVAKRLQHMMEMASQPDMARNMAEHLSAGVPDEFRDDDILMLEVIAEATRNSAVAEIVKQADRRLHAQAVTTFQRDHPRLGAAPARVELLAALFEGTLFRRLSGRGPENVDLGNLYRAVIERVLSKSD